MKDSTLKTYLETSERKDLVLSIGFLEGCYSAEIVFNRDWNVAVCEEEGCGRVDIKRGFELDRFNPFYEAPFHGGKAILQKGERPKIRICHFTKGLRHLSEIVEVMVRKIADDIPSVKTRLRMMFEISGESVPWYLERSPT